MAKKAKYDDSEKIYVRLPLSNGNFRAVRDGNFLYIEGIDLERLLPTLGHYVKSSTVDKKITGWIRHIGAEQKESERTFSKEDVQGYLTEKLSQLFESYPDLVDHPVLTGLLKTIFSLQDIILSAEDRNYSNFADAVDQFTWRVISDISPVMELLSKVEDNERLNASLAYTVENLADGDEKYLQGLANSLQGFHSIVNSLFHEEDSIREQLSVLKRDLNYREDTYVALKCTEHELDDQIVNVSLGFNESNMDDVVVRLATFEKSLVDFEVDRQILLEVTANIRKALSQVASSVKKVKEAKYALSAFLTDDQKLSELHLQSRLDKSVCKEVELWMSAKVYESGYWDTRLSSFKSVLTSIESKLSTTFDKSKFNDWKEMMDVSTAECNTTTQSTAEEISEKEMIVQSISSSSQATRMVHPKSLADLMEIFKIFIVSKTQDKNYLRGVPFRNALEVIMLAGFDLSSINLDSFRNFVRKHEDVKDVENYQDVARFYENLKGFHLLRYTIPKEKAKGSPQSRERVKATRCFTCSKVINSLEVKWGITRADFLELFKQRKEEKRKKVAEKKNSQASK